MSSRTPQCRWEGKKCAICEGLKLCCISLQNSLSRNLLGDLRKFKICLDIFVTCDRLKNLDICWEIFLDIPGHDLTWLILRFGEPRPLSSPNVKLKILEPELRALSRQAMPNSDWYQGSVAIQRNFVAQFSSNLRLVYRYSSIKECEPIVQIIFTNHLLSSFVF